MIELTWLGISLAALGLTIGNLVSGMRARTVLLAGNGKTPENIRAARLVAARANVRRDALRLVSLTACVIILIPAWMRPGDTPLTIFVVAAMLIPVPIALNAYFDRLVRLTVDRLVSENGS